MSAANSEDGKKKSRIRTSDNLRRDQEIENPCLKESRISLKCLDDKHYEKLLCQDEFLNYKNCREFWSYVMSQRRSRGVKPHLPVPEDREAVKQEYLKTFAR